MLEDKDYKGNDLDIGDLVIIASTSRHARPPRYALYDGHTSKSYRYKVTSTKYDYKSGTTSNVIAKKNLTYSSKGGNGFSTCLLTAKGPFSDDELFEISEHGFVAVEPKMQWVAVG